MRMKRNTQALQSPQKYHLSAPYTKPGSISLPTMRVKKYSFVLQENKTKLKNSNGVTSRKKETLPNFWTRRSKQ